MSKPIFDQPYGLKYQVDGIRMELSWRPDFGAEKTAALQKAQFALAQEAARLIDSYVPFDTGQLKNGVQTASKYDEGLLVYNTPYARKQYYLHAEGTDLHTITAMREWLKTCPLIAEEQSENGAAFRISGLSPEPVAEFSIEDSGIGMTPEFQKIMFEPFSRADDHRTTKVQGTGLGMAIARNIVNLMNGDIQVESAPNKGTKITVTVYLKLQENEKEQEKELLDLPVLVVDDDKTCCESTVATLQEIGIAGEWVLTGKEA